MSRASLPRIFPAFLRSRLRTWGRLAIQSRWLICGLAGDALVPARQTRSAQLGAAHLWDGRGQESLWNQPHFPLGTHMEPPGLRGPGCLEGRGAGPVAAGTGVPSRKFRALQEPPQACRGCSRASPGRAHTELGPGLPEPLSLGLWRRAEADDRTPLRGRPLVAGSEPAARGLHPPRGAQARRGEDRGAVGAGGGGRRGSGSEACEGAPGMGSSRG